MGIITMGFYKSTPATIKYLVKKEPNLYTFVKKEPKKYKYNGNTTYLGYVAIVRCEDDSSKWNVSISRNLGTAIEYESNGPNTSVTMLFNECSSDFYASEKNDELVRYYMELRNKKRTQNNIQ
jgi:hypothetical protein